MRIIDYTVLITFDLSFAKSNDYVSVNKYLEEKKFEKLSHKGNQLPSNTYLGKRSEVLLGSQSDFDGANELKKQIYGDIKKNMKGSGLESVVFVMVAPESVTAYSCSKPIKY